MLFVVSNHKKIENILPLGYKKKTKEGELPHIVPFSTGEKKKRRTLIQKTRGELRVVGKKVGLAHFEKKKELAVAVLGVTPCRVGGEKKAQGPLISESATNAGW